MEYSTDGDVMGEAMKEIDDARTDADNDAVHHILWPFVLCFGLVLMNLRRRGEELQRLIGSLEHELQERLLALSTWSQSLNGLLLERDFYYSKLREIEVRLCFVLWNATYAFKN